MKQIIQTLVPYRFWKMSLKWIFPVRKTGVFQRLETGGFCFSQDEAIRQAGTSATRELGGEPQEDFCGGEWSNQKKDDITETVKEARK